jgi:hypothetical protein
VAECVVDLLEAVQIHEQQPDEVIPSARGGQGPGELVLEEAAVREARETVVVGEKTDLLLRAHLLADVLDRPRYPSPLPQPVGHDLALLVNVAHGSIRQEQAVLDTETLGYVEGGLHLLAHGDAFVEVNGAPEEPVGRLSGAGFDAEDAEGLVGPPHLVRLGVPLPAAQARDALGVGQGAPASVELVEQLARAQQVAHAMHEERAVDGFGHEIRGAQLVGPVHRVWIVCSGHYEDRYGPRVAPPDLLAHGEPVHRGHPDVQDQQAGPIALEAGEGLLAAHRLEDGVALRLEGVAHDGAHQAIVVRHQDERTAAPTREVRQTSSLLDGRTRVSPSDHRKVRWAH